MSHPNQKIDYKGIYGELVYHYRCRFCARYMVAPNGRSYTDNQFEKYNFFCKVCIERKRRIALAKLQKKNWQKYYYNRK